MASNTIASMDGWFKKRYGKKQTDLIPKPYRLLNAIGFAGGLQPVGEEYVIPVTLKDPSGFTYANSGADAFALNAAAPGKTVRAKLTANQIVLKDAVAWEAQSISEEGIDSAYGSVTDLVVTRMKKRSMHRLECDLLYGGQGLAALTSTTITAGANIQFTTTSGVAFAPGIWIGAEGQMVDVVTSGGVVRGTFEVTGVDPDGSGGPYIYGVLPSGTTTTDSLYWSGSYGKQCVGIVTALGTSGTLWNISNVSSTGGYSLWKGNSVAVGSAALTWTGKVTTAVEKIVNKGGDGDMLLMVGAGTYRNLLDAESTRTYDSSYDPKKATRGSQGLKFETAAGGTLEVIQYTMLQPQHALLLTKDSWIRIGSQDWTYRPPGVGDNDPWLRQMENNAGFGITMYSNQTIFCNAPGRNALFTGITPS